MISWDEYFLRICDVVALKSKDDSSKIGSIIVNPYDNDILATGYNGFPRGIDDTIESRNERPKKYKYTIHAEKNCVIQAANKGISVDGMILYLNFSAFNICSDCAKTLIQAGIREVRGNATNILGSRWNEDSEYSHSMFGEAGVRMVDLDYNGDEIYDENG